MLQDNAAIDATGMFIPIRTHFKCKAWNGFGVFAYTAWSLLLVLSMSGSSKALKQRDERQRLPAFFS